MKGPVLFLLIVLALLCAAPFLLVAIAIEGRQAKRWREGACR